MLSRNIQLLIVIASSILTLIATDIILPSLPQIAHFYAVSPKEVKMLISIFLIGQFSTVLLWGVVADHMGRRKTLFLGMLLFFAGSLLSLAANSINLLLLSRFLQGAGAVVVPVAGWALIQDLFHKDDSARIMSSIGTIIAVVPLFAPAIGGRLDVMIGWKANFYCIAIYSCALCLLMLVLPENTPDQAVMVHSFKHRLRVYGDMIRNKAFISYIALFGLLNCGEWCFLTVAPFYYTHKHIAPDTMGILLMITSTGFVFGSLLASKLCKWFGVNQTINIGIHLALTSGLMLLLGEYYYWNDYQFFNAIVIGLYIMSSALLWGGTTSRALQCFADSRGSASAIRSLVLLCFSAFGTYSGQLIEHDTLYSVGIFLVVMALLALLIFHNKGLKAGRLAAEITC